MMDRDETTPVFGRASNGAGSAAGIASARRALAPVQAALSAAGFYAYGMIDDQHRWTIAADDEVGRVDVRIGSDGFAVELWASSPGLYADEENAFRRRARERLARISLPNIERGWLQSHQAAMWDEVDRGIAVRLRYELPFTRGDDAGTFVRQKLPELESLLELVETRVAS